jgi:hypothetical protein
MDLKSPHQVAVQIHHQSQTPSIAQANMNAESLDMIERFYIEATGMFGGLVVSGFKIETCHHSAYASIPPRSTWEPAEEQ